MRRVTSLLLVLMLAFVGQLSSQNLNEGFESGLIPDNWTILNEDGGTKLWVASTTYPHTGIYCARVGYETSSLDNNDWLITPPLIVTTADTDSISFWMRSYSATYADPWEVLISTTDVDPASFTVIDQGTGQLGAYVRKAYSLDAYGDAVVYLAVRYFGAYDWSLYVDDFIGPAVLLPACPKPNSLYAQNITTTSAELGWNSQGDETAWDVAYGEPGFDPDTEGTIVPVTENPYVLEGLTASSSYDVYVRADCGTDEVSAWSGVAMFNTLCDVFTAPYSQDFENGGTIPVCWAQGPGNLENWLFADSPQGHTGNNGTMGGTTTSGGYFAWIDDSTPDSDSTILLTPFIDVSGLIVPALSFFEISNNETHSNVEFYVNLWDGAMWQEQVFYNDTNTLNGEWEKILVDLSVYTISGPIQLAFVVNELVASDFYDDVAIDDVKVIEMPSCFPPILLTITDITTTGATVGWTLVGDETAWDIAYGEPGFLPDNGTIIPAATNPFPLTGLTEASFYDVYVRANCGTDEVSEWSSLASFATACELYAVPFAESFDGEQFAPVCWTNEKTAGTAAGLWNRDTAGTSPTCVPHSGAAMARFNCYSYSTGTAGILVTPAFDVEVNTVGVNFWMYRDNGYLTNTDRVNVYYNTEAGLTGAVLVGTVNRSIDLEPVVDTTSWYQYTFASPSGVNGDEGYFILEGVSAWGNNIFVDDVEVFEPQVGTLAGTVSEASKGVIQGALITAGSSEVYTDEFGDYEIPGLLPGYYTVSCEAEGYFALTVDSVEIIIDQTTPQNFVLGYAQIVVDPTSLLETLPPDGISTQTLTISNPGGTEALTYSASIEFLENAKQSPEFTIVKRKDFNAYTDASPEYAVYTNPIDAYGDILLDVDFQTPSGETQLLGCEFDGIYVWATGGGSAANPNKLYQFLPDGTLINTFDQISTSAWGMRDMAFNLNDGMIYTGDGNGLYSIDPATGVQTQVFAGTVAGTGSVIRALAYDPTNGSFWTKNFGNSLVNFEVVDATTVNVLGTYTVPEAASAYGMAYDPAGSYLWIFDQSGTPETSFVKWDIATQTTMEVVQVPLLTGSTDQLAGGAGYDFGNLVPGKVTLFGITQGTPLDKFFAMELDNSFTWVSITDNAAGTVNPGESVDIEVLFDATGLIDTNYYANININHNGQELTDGTLVVPVELIVESAAAPLAATDPSPVDDAEFVALQPEFSWTNGAGTATTRFVLKKGAGPFATTIYSSPWIIGNTVNLADVGITLLSKTTYSWQVFCKNAAGSTPSPRWSFTTIGVGTIGGVVTDYYGGAALEGVIVSTDDMLYADTTGADGTYLISGVIEGDYNVTADLEGYVSQTTPVTVEHGLNALTNFALDLYLDPPTGLQAVVEDFVNVNLSWSAPGTSVQEWLFYHDGSFENALASTSGGAGIAQYFNAPQYPCVVKSIRYFNDDYLQYQQENQIYILNADGSAILSGPYLVSNAGPDEWVEVVVDDVNVAEGGFMVATFNSLADGPFVGIDDSFYDGTLYFGSVGDFTELSVYGYFYVGSHEALVEYGADAADGGQNMVTLKPGKGEMNHTVEEMAFSNQKSIAPEIDHSVKSFLGYNVYKNDELPIYTEELFHSDLNLLAGDYFYSVKAVYDRGESEAAGPEGVSILAPPVLLSAEADYYGVQLDWMEGSSVPVDNAFAKNAISNVKMDMTKGKGEVKLPYSAGRAIGDDCIDPILINALPFTETESTCGRGNYTDTTCLGSYDGGEDIFYMLTLSEDTYVSITMETETTWTGMLLTDECPPGAECIATSTNTGVGGSQIQQFLLAGSYYIMIDTWPTPDCIPEFTITVDEYIPCVVECPAGASIEEELCGEDLNGGCNSDIPAWIPIMDGDVYCGTAYADDGRDTDWYELVLDAPKTVTWSATAEFPVLIFIIDGNKGCEGLSILTSASTAPCETATTTATVPPGTYWLWVGNQGFDGNPCGESNNYVAELTCEDAFLSYFNVFKEGVDIADVYGLDYYDMDVSNGEAYCYTVSQVLNDAALETAVSNELCATVPMIPEAGVSPLALNETHVIPPALVTTQVVTITNMAEGILDWNLAVNLELPMDGSKAYCDASTTNEDEYIANVLCGDINNASLWQGLVADYTAFSTTIEAGASEAITITNGTPWASDIVYCWVDWDMSETFEQGGNEEFILTNVGGTGASFTGAIAVPEGTPAGVYRMRVRMTYSTPPLPCDVASYGEVEDYTIVVEAAMLPWMTADLFSGSLAAGESANVTVSFSSIGLDAGNYNGSLVFTTNDPINPSVTVTADLEVIAAKGMLAGYVMDATSKGPVQGVTITAEEIRATAVTDDDGYYEMELLIGDYSVTASKDGYISQTVDTLTIALDDTTTQNFTLEFATPELLYADGGVDVISLGWIGNTAAQLDNSNSGFLLTNKEPKDIERFHGPTQKIPNTSGRATGDDCNDPIVIGAFPYSDVNTTCGRGNYTDTTCLGGYDGGEDIFYKFTLTEEMILTITMATTTTWTGMLLTDECPPSDVCIATATNSTSGGSQITDTLAEGTYYIMIDTYPSPDCIPEFTLSIEEYEECIVECPEGSIDEGEPCGEDLNGGCNGDGTTMPLVCGDVVCGTAWADAGSRDTDWYEIVVDEPTTITWSVTAEFPVYAFIIEGNFECAGSYIMAQGTGNPCETAVATATVPPGTYWLWVGNQSFYDNPCGESNDYVAELNCESAFYTYFNVQRDGETIAQTYFDTYVDMDIMPDTEYCYTVNQAVEPGLNTGESNELCATMLCMGINTCDFTMNFYDDYGDGWNGASVSILQDGMMIGSYTLSGGAFGTQTVSLCDAVETSLVWSEGFYDSECGFELFDAEGTLITSFEIGDAPLAGEFFNFTTACPAIPEQMIALEQGWNAWSAYLDPDSRMGMEAIMAPVIDQMEVTQYFNQLYYPYYGINNMDDFSNNHGYFTKMTEAATLPISGFMADPTVMLTEGWNLMSVLQECPIPAVDVFSTLPLIIAWDPVGNGIYYPDGNIFDLAYLNPGMAYWVKVDADASYTYPGCLVKGGANSTSLRAVNNTNWNDVNYTPVNHAVVFDANAVASLKAGDMIGAFTSNGWCAGLVEYTENNLGFNLFGDDMTTDMADGFVEGENLSYRLFRPATDEEFDIEVTYSFDAPNADGLFAINGVSIVTDLKLSPTSVGANLLNGLNIYPNPSSGIFNIALNNIDENINFVVMNVQGQEVYRGNLLETQELDLSAEPRGVYFIKFMNNGVLGIEKLVIK